MANILYQVQVSPTIGTWPAYLWSEFKDLLWYLTADSNAVADYPLSRTAQAYLWAGVVVLSVFGLRLARKHKLI